MYRLLVIGIVVILMISSILNGCTKEEPSSSTSPTTTTPATQVEPEITVPVSAEPEPAEFEVITLEVSSDEAVTGDTVQVTAHISNKGGTEGTYEAKLICNDKTVDNKEITLQPGKSGEIEFPYTIDKSGVCLFKIGEASVEINVLKAAEIMVETLDFDPELLFPGEETTIKATVKNSGEIKGKLAAILSVDGVEIDDRQITLEPGATSEVSFSFLRDAPGEYEIDINGKSETIEVKKVETYESEKYFFSAVYPQGWDLEEYDDGVLMSRTGLAYYSVMHDIMDVEADWEDLYEFELDYYKESRQDFEVMSKETIRNEDEISSYEVEYAYVSTRDGEDAQGKFQMLKKGRYLFTIDCSTGKNNYDLYSPIFEACFRNFSPPEVAVGAYADTDNGYSIVLPQGWCGLITGQDELLLQIFDDTGSDDGIAILVQEALYEETTAKEYGKVVVDTFSFLDDYRIISERDVNLGEEIDGYEYVTTGSISGITIKLKLLSAVRGSQCLSIMVVAENPVYRQNESKINQLYNSFTLIERQVFGVSRQDSLFLWEGEVVTLDPALSESSPADIVGAIFSGLVRLDKDLTIVPELAERWEISEDGTVYTFYLRQDATFHDGKPVTADDFKYSWERACDPELDSPKALTFLGDIVGAKTMIDGEAEELQGVRIIDDYTLEVTIDGPKPYFLDKLAYQTSYVVDRANVERGMNWTNEPNGTGPFKLKEWKKNELLILERNDDFYRGSAKLKNIVFQIFAGIPMMMYENSELDIATVSIYNLDRVLDPENPLNAELQDTATIEFSYLGFNVNMPPFDDPKVRRAFALSLDVDKLIEVSLKDIAERAAGYVPPMIPGHNEALMPLPYDTEQAIQLISESKYGSVDNLPPIVFSTIYGLADYQEAAIGMWQQNLGVNIETEVIEELEEWLEKAKEREFQIWFSGWRADYLDPQNFLEILFHSESKDNTSGYAEVDDALEAAGIERNEQKRLAMYQEIEQKILEDLPVVPLWQSSKDYVLVKPYVKGFILTPIGINLWTEIFIER